MKGLISGRFAAACGVEDVSRVEMKEVKCIAKGDDSYRYIVEIKE